MKKLIIVIYLLFAFVVSAQVIALDNNQYSLKVPKTPFMEFKILKKGEPVKLKKGKYSIDTKKGLFTFKLNRKQIIKKGCFVSGKRGGEYRIFIKNSKFTRGEGEVDGNKIKIEINPKDSTMTMTSFKKNELIEKIKVFYTKKNFDKSITTKYNKDKSYAVKNDIDKTYIDYSAEGVILDKPGSGCMAAEEAVKEAVKLAEEASKETQFTKKQYQLFPFSYNKRWGLIDSEKNVIIDPIYRSVEMFFDYQFVVFYVDGKTEIYNTITKEKLPNYGYCFSLIYEENDVKYVMFEKEDGTYHYVNLFTGEKIKKLENKSEKVSSDELEYDEYDESENVIDLSTEIVKEIKYPKQFDFSGKPVYINSKGKKHRVSAHFHSVTDKTIFLRFGRNKALIDKRYVPNNEFMYPEKYLK